MDIDAEKLEQVVLALLYLNSFEEGTGRRAWKSFPWSIMDSRHAKATGPGATAGTSTNLTSYPIY